MSSTWSRVLASCAVLALAPVAAACTRASGTPAADANGAAHDVQSPSSSLVATRWWSNPVSSAGSTIDPKDPEAAAAQLHASAGEYCGMLRQTVAAGRSILPNVTANDPALLTSTKAFIAELEAVAPSAVAGPWKVLGPAVLALVGSGGDPTKVRGVDAAAVRKAADKVAADARHSCGVDLNRKPKNG